MSGAAPSDRKKADPLTTSEAWREMARWWDRAQPCECCGKPCVAPRASGLCAALGIMRFRGYITEAQEAEMLADLPPSPVLVPGVRPYLWPTDAEGAKARAEFCRGRAKVVRRRELKEGAA